MNAADITFLHQLEQVIRERRLTGGGSSYTASLFAAGPGRIAQKVGEEGVELALAGATGDRSGVIAESADLLYHMLVLLSAHEIGLVEVVDELRKRQR